MTKPKVPFTDLTGQKFLTYTVTHLASPISKIPEYQNDAIWALKCECGATRQIRGTTLLAMEFKQCHCTPPKLKVAEGNKAVGEGLITAKYHEPDKFLAYLKRRAAEDEKANGRVGKKFIPPSPRNK